MFTRVEVSNCIYNTLKSFDCVKKVQNPRANMTGWHNNRDIRLMNVRLENSDVKFQVEIRGCRHEGFRVKFIMKGVDGEEYKLLYLNRVLFERESDEFLFGHNDDYYVETFDRLFMKAMNTARDILFDQVSGELQSYDNARLKVERVEEELERAKQELANVQSTLDSIPAFKLS